MIEYMVSESMIQAVKNKNSLERRRGESELQFLQRMKRAGRVWARRPGTKCGLCSIDMAIHILQHSGVQRQPAWMVNNQYPPHLKTHNPNSLKLVQRN